MRAAGHGKVAPCQPENSLNCCMLLRLGGVVDRVWKQADDPCRAIKIVALTGQLCATDQLTPDRDRTRYSKNARGGRAVPARLSRMGLESAAPRKRNMIARAAAGLVTEAPEISSIEYRSAQAACRFTVYFWGKALLSPNSDGRLSGRSRVLGFAFLGFAFRPLRRNLHL